MTVSVAIVGSGPRGISLLQRLSTRLQSVNYAPDSSLSFVLHIFDCSYLGAGRIWNPDQVKVLRMNTPANSVTLFPQEAGCSDSNSPTGPNLYEWVQLVRGDLAPEEIKFNYGNKLLKSFQVLRSDVASLYESTISDLSPNDFVPRSLYGEYLRWVYDTSITQMPSWVKLHQYRQEVVDISPKKGRDLLILKDGSSVTADITMLATGWASSSRTINEPSQRHTTVPFVPAANPAEQDLGVLRSGQTTVVQGFGTCFFDLMALVTEGRGESFTKTPPADLVYGTKLVAVNLTSRSHPDMEARISQNPHSPIRVLSGSLR